MHETHSKPAARRWAALLVLAVTTALAFTTLLIPAQSANAAPAPAPQPRSYYGAISLAADGAAGVSYDYRSRAAAYGRAQRECKARSNYPGTCTRMGWVRNGCAALAARFNRDGFVSRVKYRAPYRTRAAAQRAARRNFPGSRNMAWVCTTRR